MPPFRDPHGMSIAHATCDHSLSALSNPPDFVATLCRDDRFAIWFSLYRTHVKYDWYIDNPPGRSGIAIHGGKTGENTTGCFIPGDSFEPNKEKSNYVINNNQKKEELFRFFDNYGHNGIKINVGPDLEDWYK